MLTAKVSPAEKRQSLRKLLQENRLVRVPGGFSPLVAMLIEQTGFEGVYVSGGALSANMGMPDIGLTTLPEVAGQAAMIAGATSLPAIVDIDTGFGEPINVARTIQTLEQAGLAGCHLEDQSMPKRCGHLDKKQLVSPQEMARKIKAAADAKTDPNFLLIARTDSRAAEGLDAAIDRAKRYLDAGAEMIFPEALADEAEFAVFRKAIDAPLLANMTEFGKSPLLSVATLEAIGYDMAIYPVTALRLAMKAIERGLKAIADNGDQQEVLCDMQTRQELYELLRYEEYNRFDEQIFNFTL
ncbi:methylisocitrate lyase [Botrimarina hoheduenensis]|uniref:Methylisocitrate lyase n=1 Tax=Botrimarina hoheduenensis TaxID=2528000 RepID=A0A5C5VPU2_9BACT|nr:methylisocitrate lyase [Botrimarina hoheduenensis]TWT40167.1 Methylisocitrate lyase [Botrimarina hoheduenensis]